MDAFCLHFLGHVKKNKIWLNVRVKLAKLWKSQLQNQRCPALAFPAAMETEVHQLLSNYISPSEKKKNPKDKKIASTSL